MNLVQQVKNFAGPNNFVFIFSRLITNILSVKRKVNIILLVWGTFSFVAILFTFQRGLQLEKKHVAIIGLAEDVKSEFFQSQIYREDFLLTGDTAAFRPLMRHLEAADRFLGQIVVASEIDPAETDSTSVRGFVCRIPRVRGQLQQIINLFEERRTNHENFDVTRLNEAFLNYNIQFKEFESGQQQYLSKRNRSYKRASAVLVLGSFVVLVVSFLIISRLMETLALTERRLVEKTVETEQKERNRIATDLHDGLGSLLSSIHLYLKIMEAELREGKDISERIVQLKQLSDLSLQNVEAVINNLEPLFLRKYGLVISLQRMCQRLNKLDKILFEFRTDEFTLQLSKSTDLILYRIFSELTNNALKHSQASRVSLELKSVKQTVVVRYSDDGIGLGPGKVIPEDESKLGLRNIISRVESLGGTHQVVSKPGEGLWVELRFRVAAHQTPAKS